MSKILTQKGIMFFSQKTIKSRNPKKSPKTTNQVFTNNFIFMVDALEKRCDLSGVLLYSIASLNA